MLVLKDCLCFNCMLVLGKQQTMPTKELANTVGYPVRFCGEQLEYSCGIYQLALVLKVTPYKYTQQHAVSTTTLLHLVEIVGNIDYFILQFFDTKYMSLIRDCIFCHFPAQCALFLFFLQAFTGLCFHLVFSFGCTLFSPTMVVTLVLGRASH